MQEIQFALEYLNFAGTVEGLGVSTGTEGVQGYNFAAGGVSKECLLLDTPFECLKGGELLRAQVSSKPCPWEVQTLMPPSGLLD